MPHATNPTPQAQASPTLPSDSSNPAASPTTSPSSRPELTPELSALASRFFSSARTGSLPIFQQALPAGLPPNLTNEKGDTILMLACYHGHLPLARLLLDHGADPNVLNDRGQSPLAGVVFKHEKEIVRLLLERGADPDIGEPTAGEAVGIFGLEGEWGEVFEEARRKIRVGKEGDGGQQSAGNGNARG